LPTRRNIEANLAGWVLLGRRAPRTLRQRFAAKGLGLILIIDEVDLACPPLMRFGRPPPVFRQQLIIDRH
jgi:hypothetical protein